MSGHTPGPWEVDVRGREGNENDPWHCAIVGTAIGRHVVIADTLNCSCVFSPDDQRANAHMLAASPALLAALKESALQLEYLSGKFGETGTGNAVLARIRAAIDAAEPRP